jgi:hypothetical protein
VTVHRGAVEYGIVVVAVLAIQALSFTTQARITANGGRGYDGTVYYRMAERLAEGQPPNEPSRFARRIGTPLLAALADPGDLINGFQVVNVCAAFASTLLLLAWLRRYLSNPWLRIALVVVHATHWLQLVRFTFFYPVLVDACAQALCFAGLNCIAWYEKKPGRWPLVAVALVGAAGVCFREIVILVPVAFLFARNPRLRRGRQFPYIQLANAPRVHELIPLALACAALVTIGSVIRAADPGFSASNHLLDRALSRSLLTYLLGWMVAFGPGLFLVLFDWRTVLDFFTRHTWTLVFTAGVASVGWAGSLESERHALNWAAPIVYLLIGCTIQQHRRWSTSPVLVGVVLMAQAFVSRLFWTTPQPAVDNAARDPVVVLTPLGRGATYLDLFPNELPRALAWVTFGEYAVLGGLTLWMWLRVSGVTPESLRVRTAGAFGHARRIGLHARLSILAGLRLLGMAGASRALVAGFLAIGGPASLLLMLQPVQPVPINVRWKGDVDAARRASLARHLHLAEGRPTEGTTWAYLLTDPSTASIRAIVQHPSVDDTAHVNRVSFRPDFAHDQERRAILHGALIGGGGAVVALMWMAHRRSQASRRRS